MKQSKIFNTEQVKSIIAGITTAFYELVNPQPILAVMPSDAHSALIATTGIDEQLNWTVEAI